MARQVRTDPRLAREPNKQLLSVSAAGQCRNQRRYQHSDETWLWLCHCFRPSAVCSKELGMAGDTDCLTLTELVTGARRN